MRLGNHLILVAFCFTAMMVFFPMQRSLAQQEQSVDWKEELRQIDEEVKRAQDLKDRYLFSARRAEDEGMRWQFMQNQKQEAKRAFQRAEDKRKAAAMLQTRIDILNARKAQILQEHPRG
jgi:hypothetical protein